jgi:Uma2 family endonuclease
MASLPTSPLTEEQYLAIERDAEFKSEFYDGQMFAMAGGSLNHALLSSAIGALLHTRIPAGCRTLNSEMRVKVSKTGLYTYPDCSVICGEPELFGNQKDVLLNPLLIVEVLSPSTEAYDRGRKFELYQSLESLREYLLIHQDRRHVEHFSKQDDGSWLLRTLSGQDAEIALDRLGVRIALGELYATAVGLDPQ